MSRWLARTEFDTWSGQWLRKLRRRHNEDCVNIVAYHSIASDDSLFTRGTTLRHTPSELERHMDYLVDHYRPVSLRTAVDALARGESLRRAVVITIDDGLADSLRHAMPILVRRRIPMTVFAVTSVIGNKDLQWQHKLTWLVQSGLGPKVKAAMETEGYPPAKSDQSVEEYARHNFRPDLPDILEAIVEATGTTGVELAARMRPYLEPEEMAEADSELVEFGNHTHTHAILSALDADAQRVEMEQARDIIQSIVGRPPFALAYPFGLKRHYNIDSTRLAAETGHRAALDARRRINRVGVSPMQLSRKPAPCGSQSAFEKAIEDWPDNAALPPSKRR